MTTGGTLAPPRRDLAGRLRRHTGSGRRYLPEVDGLRFLAIVPVLVSHLSERVVRSIERDGALSAAEQRLVDLIPTGDVGVYLFFVLSGFIIALPMSRQAAVDPDRAPNVGYRSYMRRRLTRLEPPYLVVLFGLFLGITALDALGQGSVMEGTNSFSKDSVSLGDSLAASVFYLHGLVFQARPRINPPAWSLEIEFQFYVLAPLLILVFVAIGRRFGRPGASGLTRRLVAEAAGLVAIAVGLKAAVWLFVPDDLHEFLVVEYLPFFLVGFAISRLYAEGLVERIAGRAASVLFLVGVAASLYLNYFDQKDIHPTYETVRSIVLLGTLGSVFLGALAGGVGGRFTARKWISIVGGMCYSIYLLHLAMFQASVSLLWRVLPIDSLVPALLVYYALVVPPVLAACAVFYVLVERPCMDPTWPNRLWARVTGR
ncbi:MAG: acyltransferase [Acidimicrobiales bacterium]|nr:acyltransferase [Acidimicrobiales bacterium]